MTTKEFGAGVSGYRDPEGRSWETVAYQAAKPVVDAELNLIQDAQSEMSRKLRLQALPTGWQGSPLTSFPFIASAVSNELKFSALVAYVNGWVISVGNTGMVTDNLVSLGAGPATGSRTDLVVLEVWRKLLIETTAGKSPAGRIWRDGNVKVPAGSDVALNYADDIVDTNVGSITTKRVQIQYRIRTISGVDLFANSDGMTDSAALARSVPASAAAPDGNSTAFAYTLSATDPGLWVAGDGSAANTLGTVDGYMYAIPLCAVFRRNTTAWSRNSNQNGGVASPGPSTRPDGLLTDIFVAGDIFDLRTFVSPTGWDYSDLGAQAAYKLFDNALVKEISTIATGGGHQGHTLLRADEIGVSNANGGDGTITGDTPGADFIGEFDGIRRTFGDRVTYETLWLRYVPANGSGGGPSWANSDIITISPTSLPVHPYTAYNWASRAPTGTLILEVLEAHFSGHNGTGSKSVPLLPEQSAGADCFRALVSGAGTAPVGPVTLKLVRTGSGTTLVPTTEPLFVKVLVAYPPDQGLTRTPDPGTEVVQINNIGQLPAASPIFYQSSTFTVDAPHREVRATYRTVAKTLTLAAGNTVVPAQLDYDVQVPERIASLTSATIASDSFTVGGVGTGSVSVLEDGYTVRFKLGFTYSYTGSPVVLNYTAEKALPQNGEQITIYYRAKVPQTAREALLPASLPVIVRYVSPQLYTIVAGTGSQDEAFPYPFASIQSGGIYPSSGDTYEGDHRLNAGAAVFPGMESRAGFFALAPKTPLVPAPLTLSRVSGDIDIEGRSYYKAVSGYQPSAAGDNFINAVPHKVVLPLIVELTTSSTLGRKGELLLMTLQAWHKSDVSNSLGFSATLAENFSSASVYRLRALNGKGL